MNRKHAYSPENSSNARIRWLPPFYFVCVFFQKKRKFILTVRLVDKKRRAPLLTGLARLAQQSVPIFSRKRNNWNLSLTRVGCICWHRKHKHIKTPFGMIRKRMAQSGRVTPFSFPPCKSLSRFDSWRQLLMNFRALVTEGMFRVEK